MLKVKHLYWRAGFGLSPKEWQIKKDWSIDKAVQELFEQPKTFDSIKFESNTPKNYNQLSIEEKNKVIKLNREKIAECTFDWINRMGNPDYNCLLERMTLFWHDHFACRIGSGHLGANQLNTIRKHALGSFRNLCHEIAKDPAMIRYLNNQQNRKSNPNENFARELLELFTLGRGHYSEKDIKEAARAFTGWSSTIDGNFIFQKSRHDYGPKTFFGRSGNFNGEDIIEIILERREVSKFLTRKIYKYFVNEIPDEVKINQLAKRFFDSDYDIADLMRAIFSSDWFYHKKNIGNKIKSPVDLCAGLIRNLDISFQNPRVLIRILRGLGQLPFFPPNVAGWPSGKNWIDNSTLLLRLSLPSSLAKNAKLNFKPTDSLKAIKEGKDIGKSGAIVNFASLNSLVQGLSENATFDTLNNYLLVERSKIPKRDFDKYLKQSSRLNYSESLSLSIMSLPDYQMC